FLRHVQSQHPVAPSVDPIDVCAVRLHSFFRHAQSQLPFAPSLGPPVPLDLLSPGPPERSEKRVMPTAPFHRIRKELKRADLPDPKSVSKNSVFKLRDMLVLEYTL